MRFSFKSGQYLLPTTQCRLLLHDCVIAPPSVLWSRSVSLRCLKLKGGESPRWPVRQLQDSSAVRAVMLLTFASFEPRIPPHPHPHLPPPTPAPLQLFTSEALNLLSHLSWRYGVSEATRLFMFQTLERKKHKIIVSLCGLVRSSEGGLNAPYAGKKDPLLK